MVNQACGSGFRLLGNFSLVEVELTIIILVSTESKSELGSVLKYETSKTGVKNLTLIHP